MWAPWKISAEQTSNIASKTTYKLWEKFYSPEKWHGNFWKGQAHSWSRNLENSLPPGPRTKNFNANGLWWRNGHESFELRMKNHCVESVGFLFRAALWFRQWLCLCKVFRDLSLSYNSTFLSFPPLLRVIILLAFLSCFLSSSLRSK